MAMTSRSTSAVANRIGPRLDLDASSATNGHASENDGCFDAAVDWQALNSWTLHVLTPDVFDAPRGRPDDLSVTGGTVVADGGRPTRPVEHAQ
jgi:hypothetical protein